MLQLLTSRYEDRLWRKKIEKTLSLPASGIGDPVQRAIFLYLKHGLKAYKSRRADPDSWIVGGLATMEVIQRAKAWTAVGVFAAAIVMASLGLVYLPLALAAVVVLYVLLRIVPLTQIYESVEWSVIVLLGSMIPIGAALDASGGTALIADGILSLSRGASPVVVLILLMVVTMTLSDILNNAATAVVMAPIGVGIAERLGASPDPFLMAVAIGASCAFLTPIGHQNNALVMGPGGYRFWDYWRMGLPLEILIVAVATPMILWIWPLYG